MRAVDFAYYEVYVSLTSGFNPTGWNGSAWTGKPNAPGVWNGSTNSLYAIVPSFPATITGLNSRVVYYVRAVQVDKSGLRSIPAAEMQITAGDISSSSLALNGVDMKNLNMSILDYVVPQLVMTAGARRYEPTGYGNCLFLLSAFYYDTTINSIHTISDNTYGYSYSGGAGFDGSTQILLPNTSGGACKAEFSGYIKAPNGLASGMMVLYLNPSLLNVGSNGSNNNLQYCGVDIIHNGKTFSGRFAGGSPLVLVSPVLNDVSKVNGVLTGTPVYRWVFTGLDTNVAGTNPITLRFVNYATSPTGSSYLWKFQSWALAYCANT